MLATLTTVTNLAELLASMIPVVGALWLMLRPWLKSVVAQLVPDHDPKAPTMRALQEKQTVLQEAQVAAQADQTATMQRIESKLDERLTEFGNRLGAVEEAVRPIPQLVSDVADLGQRVAKIEGAAHQ